MTGERLVTEGKGRAKHMIGNGGIYKGLVLCIAGCRSYVIKSVDKEHETINMKRGVFDTVERY